MGEFPEVSKDHLYEDRIEELEADLVQSEATVDSAQGRIAELEDALEKYAPEHKLLNF